MLRAVAISAAAAAVALAGLVVVPTTAAAVTVSRAELRGGQLRLDGVNAAPGVTVTATSASSSAGARSDISGAYHVQASNFRADDCTVVVSDRQTALATVTLSGCTPAPVTPTPTNPAPSGTCVITPSGATPTYPVGALATTYFTTSGCNTSTGPAQWSFLSGRIPVGMTGPYFQGQDAAALSGVPTLEATYSFTLGVTDSVGATDTQTFTVVVAAPRPLTVTTASTAPGAVRSAYWVILGADGGLPGYTWSLASGALPAGLQLTPRGSIAGTPTASGTSSFTVAVTDARGATAVRTFALTVA